jgi:hypothetical protein
MFEKIGQPRLVVHGKQRLIGAALGFRGRFCHEGISQSTLIVAAVEALLGASGQIDHLTPFIAGIKGAPPRLSESVDDVYR